MLANIFLTRFSTASHSLGVMLLGLLFVSIFLMILHVMGFDVEAALRDSRINTGPEAGLVSDLGILLTSLAGAFGLLRAWMYSSFPVLLLGIFCCLFALDDGLLLHERLGPFEIGVFAFYGIFLLEIILVYRRETRSYFLWPVIVVLFAFVASAVVDLLWERLTGPMASLISADEEAVLLFGYVLEDSAKFAGIVTLAGFVFGEGLVVKSHRSDATATITKNT